MRKGENSPRRLAIPGWATGALELNDAKQWREGAVFSGKEEGRELKHITRNR